MRSFPELLSAYRSFPDPVYLLSEYISSKKAWLRVSDINRQIAPWVNLIREIINSAQAYEQQLVQRLSKDIQEVEQSLSSLHTLKPFESDSDLHAAFAEAAAAVEKRLERIRREMGGRKGLMEPVDLSKNSVSSSMDQAKLWLQAELQKNRLFSFRRRGHLRAQMISYLTQFCSRIEKEVLFEKEIAEYLADIHKKIKLLRELFEKADIQGTESMPGILRKEELAIEALLQIERTYESSADQRILALKQHLEAERQKSLQLSMITGYKHAPYNLHSLVFVHMTRYFPTKGILWTRVSGDSGLRDTLHFSINGPVGNVDVANWENAPIAVLIPGSVFPLKRIRNLARFDTFIFGNLKIPAGSVILTTKHIVAEAASHENVPVSAFAYAFEKNGILVKAEEDNVSIYSAVQKLLENAGRGGMPLYETSNEEDTWKLAAQLGVSSIRHVQTQEHEYEDIRRAMDTLQIFLRKKGNWKDGTFDGNEDFKAGNWVSYERYFSVPPHALNWMETNCGDPLYRRVCSLMLQMLTDTLKLLEFAVGTIRLCIEKGPISLDKKRMFVDVLGAVYEGVSQAKVGYALYAFSPNAAKNVDELIEKIKRHFEICREHLNRR